MVIFVRKTIQIYFYVVSVNEAYYLIVKLIIKILQKVSFIVNNTHPSTHTQFLFFDALIDVFLNYQSIKQQKFIDLCKRSICEMSHTLYFPKYRARFTLETLTIDSENHE